MLDDSSQLLEPAPAVVSSSSSSSNEEEDDEYEAETHATRPRHQSSVRRPTSFGFLSTVSSSNAPVSGQTALHHLLASQAITVAKVKDIIQQSPEMLKERDANGRLPLHTLGNNCDFLSTLEGQSIARECVLILIDAFPASIVAEDDQKHAPFVFLVRSWVEWAHHLETKKASKSSGLLQSPHQTMQTAFLFIHDAYLGESKGQGASSSSTGQPPVNADDALDFLSKSSHQLPTVFVSEQVEWSFQMLSLAMNYLGGSTIDPHFRARPLLSMKKQRERKGALAHNLVLIPQLFKTVLQLESNEIRNEIMSSSIFRRAMLCRNSIGLWLTKMIRSNNADLAVDFMRMISELCVEDFVGPWRKPSTKDVELFKEAESGVYEEVEKLTDLMPSLFVMSSADLDRSVSLPLVWYLMNRRITTPFTVGVTVTDFQLHLTLLIAVRDISFNGYTSNFQWLGAQLVIFMIALYQIVRKCTEFMVLYRISSTVAKRYGINFWNLIDLCGILGALLSVVMAAERSDKGFANSMGSAAVLGFLWFRILGFLNIVNEQLATFIEALKQILFDIRFFCVVFMILIFCFGDMLHLMFLNDDGIDCVQEQEDSSIGQDFCSPYIIDSYIRVYGVIIGDFELSDYQQNNAVTFLWVLMTFLGTVVLLNVLIAVVTHSYDSSLNSSVILFRKSRAESVVSNVAVERLLKSGKSDQRYLYPFVRFCSRWALVLLFFWTVLFSTFYMIERLARMSVKANVFVLLFLALMSVLLLFSLWSALLFVLKIILQRFIPQSRVKSKARKILKAINERIIVKGIASTLFGVDTTDMEGGESSRPPKLTTVAAFLVSLYLLPAMMKCWHTSRDWRPCYRIKHLPMQWVKV